MIMSEHQLEWPSWPKFDDEHKAAVNRVIDSNQLFAAQEVKSFELEFSGYVRTKHAIGVGNATQALHLALAALNIGPGDEVIVTPYSWISSASCVLMQSAIPVFVDIEVDSFGICPEKLESAITPRTKAVILVHMFGLSSKVRDILSICTRRGIHLIEDASHAHGAKLMNKALGTFGSIGVFSLHQRKAIPTGDGGILVTDDEKIAQKLHRLRSFGDSQLSYNYRMTEFSAALGRVALGRLTYENSIRRSHHETLKGILSGGSVSVIDPHPDSFGVFYSNLLDLNISSGRQERVLNFCRERHVPLKRTWVPLNKHPHFKRDNMIGRVTPWDHIENFVEPSDRVLANSELYQEHRLFELDCHPLVSSESVKLAASMIKEAVDFAR